MNGSGLVLGGLALFLGMGAGFVLWSDPTMPRPDPSRAERDAAHEAAPGHPSPARGETRAAAAPIAIAPYKAPLSSLASNAATREAVRGSGTISGRVTVENGQPLPGAFIRVAAAEEQRRPQLGRPRRPRDARRERREGERAAVTDGDGRFVIGGLEGDAFVVSAWAEGYEIDGPTGEMHVRPGNSVHLVALPLIPVPVSVLLPGGGSPERAVIHVEGEGRETYVEWEPSHPEVLLPPGHLTLAAEAGDDARYRSEPERVFVPVRGNPSPVSLPLVALCGVKGRVVLPRGFEPPDRSVFVFHKRSGSGQELEDETPCRRRPLCLSPRSGYAFEAFDLTPGTWTFAAGAEDGPLWVSEMVDVPAGEVVELVLVVPSPDTMAGLRVAVLGPSGGPVADARVWISRDPHPGDWGETVARLEDGRFLVETTDQDHDPASTALLSIASPRFGSTVLDIPPRGVTEVVARLADPASLHVDVTGHQGLPPESLLSAHLLAGRPPDQYPVSTDHLFEQGKANVIVPVQPGSYHFILALDNDYGWGPVHEQQILIAPGANTVVVPMPPLHDLTVVVPEDSNADALTLGDSHAYARECRRPAKVAVRDGHAIFRGLTPGTYVLSTWGLHDRISMRVQVPTGGPVAFEPDVPSALVLRWTEADPYPTSVGLLSEDLIVGIDGAGPDGSRSLQTILRGTLMARKECRLTVERNGRRFDVTVDTTRFSEATRNGTLLRPPER